MLLKEVDNPKAELRKDMVEDRKDTAKIKAVESPGAEDGTKEEKE